MLKRYFRVSKYSKFHCNIIFIDACWYGWVLCMNQTMHINSLNWNSHLIMIFYFSGALNANNGIVLSTFVIWLLKIALWMQSKFVFELQIKSITKCDTWKICELLFFFFKEAGKIQSFLCEKVFRFSTRIGVRKSEWFFILHH